MHDLGVDNDIEQDFEMLVFGEHHPSKLNDIVSKFVRKLRVDIRKPLKSLSSVNLTLVYHYLKTSTLYNCYKSNKFALKIILKCKQFDNTDNLLYLENVLFNIKLNNDQNTDTVFCLITKII